MTDSPSSRQTAASSTADVLSGMQDKQRQVLKPLGSASVLRSWVQVSLLWPEGPGRLSVLAIAGPAVVHLSAAAMQVPPVVSRDLPAAVTAGAAAGAAGAAAHLKTKTQQAAPSYAVEVLHEAVQSVLQAVTWLAITITNHMEAGQTSFMFLPELQPLLVMPEFTSALATMLVPGGDS